MSVKWVQQYHEWLGEVAARNEEKRAAVNAMTQYVVHEDFSRQQKIVTGSILIRVSSTVSSHADIAIEHVKQEILIRLEEMLSEEGKQSLVKRMREMSDCT
jgi:hypothetical protein